METGDKGTIVEGMRRRLRDIDGTDLAAVKLQIAAHRLSEFWKSNPLRIVCE